MTKPMANPTPRAQKRRDLTPTPVTRGVKKRGASLAVDVTAIRMTGKNTSSAAGASEVDVDKPLTEKQKLFVEHWAKGDSIPSAALRAGYNNDSIAYRLVRMPNILALKAEMSAKYEEAAQMTRQKVMDGFMEAIDMAKLMSEPATMVSGWREIAKLCGYTAPVEHRMKVDVSGNIVVDKLNSMSDAELLKLITSGPGHNMMKA